MVLFKTMFLTLKIQGKLSLGFNLPFPHLPWQSCSPVLLQGTNPVPGEDPEPKPCPGRGKLGGKGSVHKLQGAAGYVRKRLRKLQGREEQENC